MAGRAKQQRHHFLKEVVFLYLSFQADWLWFLALRNGSPQMPMLSPLGPGSTTAGSAGVAFATPAHRRSAGGPCLRWGIRKPVATARPLSCNMLQQSATQTRERACGVVGALWRGVGDRGTKVTSRCSCFHHTLIPKEDDIV